MGIHEFRHLKGPHGEAYIKQLWLNGSRYLKAYKTIRTGQVKKLEENKTNSDYSK